MMTITIITIQTSSMCRNTARQCHEYVVLMASLGLLSVTVWMTTTTDCLMKKMNAILVQPQTIQVVAHYKAQSTMTMSNSLDRVTGSMMMAMVTLMSRTKESMNPQNLIYLDLAEMIGHLPV